MKKEIVCWLPLVPLAGFVLALRVGHMEGVSLLMWELLLAFGYGASLWDLRQRRVPNQLVGGMLGAWVLVLVPQLFFQTEQALVTLISGGVGFLLAGMVFLVVYLISRKGLGGGDVKFMSASGLYLGAGCVLPAMLYGCILSAVTGVALLAMKKIGRKDAIPLVPFLYVGMVLTMLFR